MLEREGGTYIRIKNNKPDMETQETNSQTTKKEKSLITGRALAGTVLLIVGSVLIADRLGVNIPHWVFSWPMIVIAVGIFVGAKDKFRDWGWLIPVAVGVVFLINYGLELPNPVARDHHCCRTFNDLKLLHKKEKTRRLVLITVLPNKN
jgi:hypothetical protein